MPRTKRPTKKQQRSSEQNNCIAIAMKIDQIGREEKKNIELKTQAILNEVELAFQVLTESFSDETLQRTIGDLKTELRLRDRTNASSNNVTRAMSRTDDGYVTESSSHSSGGRSGRMLPPRTASRTTSRRSRSADASTRKGIPRAIPSTQRRRSQSVFKTPMYKSAGGSFPPITPKVAPNTPLTVLRQPRPGEMVVSLSGSPVAVPTCYTMQAEEKANCNILLQDGTMLSIQPINLRESQTFIPTSLMGPNVCDQLKTLKHNLDTILLKTEKK